MEEGRITDTSGHVYMTIYSIRNKSLHLEYPNVADKIRNLSFFQHRVKLHHSDNLFVRV